MSEKEIKALDAFVFKVSMEGFTYAKKNYPPEGLPEDITKKLLGKDGEDYLEQLMERYGLEYS